MEAVYKLTFGIRSALFLRACSRGLRKVKGLHRSQLRELIQMDEQRHRCVHVNLKQFE